MPQPHEPHRSGTGATERLLATAQQLARELREPHPPVVLDVRWRLGGPPGHDDYLAGHLPGAVYVDLDTELAGHGQPTDGRHPLPPVAALQAAVRRWGIQADDRVVVYDGHGNLAAARAWWLLRWVGIGDVRLLDGALPAWTAAGLRLDAGEVTPQPGNVVARPGSLPTLTAEATERWPHEGVLLDARAGERYRGETEPVDPVAGHIPGALSAPTSETLLPDGRFRPAADLAAHFAHLGVTAGASVAVYCGSGVTAAHELVALALAGVDATLYPGSWSQWSNQGRPVAVGADPGVPMRA